MKNKKISRKQFLAYTAGGIAGLGVAAVPLSSEPLYGAKYPDVPENQKELKPNRKTVCIIGGGLAGMQAAVELSSRGFKVTVLEKSGIPGGKLKSWRDKTFAPKNHPLSQNKKGMVREHGIHAIWGFYNNLREFMGRHKFQLYTIPNDYSIYNFLDKDGTNSKIKYSKLPSPYARISQAFEFLGLEHLKDGDKTKMLTTAMKFFTFDYTDKKQREYLDSMTFAEYGKKLGLSKEAIFKIFDSVTEMAYFDNVDKCSALTIVLLFQLIGGSPDDMKVDLYMNPPGETFISPMEKYLLSKGGEIHYNTEVTKINFDKDKIKSVTASALKGMKVTRCQVCGELIYRDNDYHVCPFCGAEQDKLKVLTTEEKQEKTFQADYYVMALDVPAAQKLISYNLKEFNQITEKNLLKTKKPSAKSSAFSLKEYFNKILDLNATEVYVADMWFEGTDIWKKRFKTDDGVDLDFFATGFDHLGITLNWSLPIENNAGIKETVIKEYKDANVSIIETQIAKVHKVGKLKDKEIVDKCYQELKTVMPDLPPYQSYFLNKWRNYTRYLPGDETNRPYVQSPIDNFMIIGDICFMPHASVFMEKTNVSAKWVTNILLDKIGQKQGKIKILKSGTPSNLVKILSKITSVYA